MSRADRAGKAAVARLPGKRTGRGSRSGVTGTAAGAANPSDRLPPLLASLRRIPATAWLTAAVFAILIAAAWLRLTAIGTSPPGLHVDEAYNIWNTDCLVHTGRDQYGVRWPIFYTAGFGENRTTLFLYLLMPFLAVGGLSVTAARVGAGLYGVLAVAATYYVGRRLLGPAVGIVAAALLAFNPWHLQLSRWAHEATVTPLLVVAPIAGLIWAGIVPAGPLGRPRPLAALAAGLVTGICCYGYPAVRMFLPCFLAIGALLAIGDWRRLLASRGGKLSAAMLAIGLASTLGPLAWAHLSDPAIGKRAASLLIWSPADSLAAAAAKVLSRYPDHFGIGFLFRHGDTFNALAPPEGRGLFQWTLLPLLVIGVIALIRRRSTPGARALLAWMVLYPLPDLIYRHPSPHALRSAAGVPALVMLAAMGAVTAGRWLLQHFKRRAAVAAIVTVSLIFATETGLFLRAFFGPFNRETAKVVAFPTDVLAACQWLQPRLPSLDAVFFTARAAVHPYVFTLVGLDYAPARWLADEPEWISGPLAGGAYSDQLTCRRFGTMNFILDDVSVARIDGLRTNGRDDHVAFVVRPGELSGGGLGEPSERLLWPDGRVSLLLYDIHM